MSEGAQVREMLAFLKGFWGFSWDILFYFILFYLLLLLLFSFHSTVNMELG